MREWLFTGFGAFTVAAAACVVLAKDPVYSAFSLILSFFGLSAVYLLWGATFIAVIQILIYTGAIVVLFVFVVMLINLSKAPPSQPPNWLGVACATLASWYLSVLLLRVLTIGIVPQSGNIPLNGIRAVSKLLFTRYLWPFEVLSIFLLVLIVAIFALARPEPEESN